MSPPLRRLCGLLIRDLYGEFYSFVFKRLADQGRLTAQQLAQRSRLPLKQVQAGLAALIRLHLVQHYSSSDNPATYSADLDNAYDLLRVGKLVRAADENYSSLAAIIISTACDLRYCTVAELKSQLRRDAADHPDLPVMGLTIDRLLEDKFLIHVRRAHFLHPHDVRREVEIANGAAGGLTKVTGSKAKLDLEARVVEGVHQRLTTTLTETGYFNAKAISEGQTNGGHPVNGAHALNGETPSDKVLVKPNLRSIGALARIRCAHDEAYKKLGKRTAAVLECAVAQVIPRVHWDDAASAEPRLDLEKLSEDIQRTGQDIRGGVSDGRQNTLPGQDDSMEIVRDLNLLSEGPFDFLRTSFDDGWYLDLDRFNKYVQGVEVMRLMASRVDETANRILSILVAKGRLEEKTLQEMGLLSAKELRQSIAQLQQMGYVELQEVPREASRQPNRTLYLWFHDTERVRHLILDSVYTAMANLLQLLGLEREHVADTLSKVERDDVKGREADFLAPAELDLLKRFRRLEMWLIAELHRLDDTVAILQDL